MASSGTGLFHVDAIVLDEVHYLSDISRGTVWEEIVSSSSSSSFTISLWFFLFRLKIYWFSVSFEFFSGYLLPKGGSTYMSISHCCKPRRISWLDWGGESLNIFL